MPIAARNIFIRNIEPDTKCKMILLLTAYICYFIYELTYHVKKNIFKNLKLYLFSQYLVLLHNFLIKVAVGFYEKGFKI